jgi:uncharacterized protein (TIGR00251 family)
MGGRAGVTAAERLEVQLRAEGRLLLKVKVAPKSGRCELAGFLADGALKARVRAAPERGKANEELCELLARVLHVHRSCVRIVSGETSALKQVRVELAG